MTTTPPITEAATAVAPSEVVMFEAVATEVITAKVSPPIPMVPRSPRPNLSTSKKKQKKPQQVLVWQSQRKNPTEVRQKGMMDK